MLRVQYGERKMNKLKKIFNMATISNFIDVFYGTFKLISTYYMCYIAYAGLSYLYEISPNSQVFKIVGEVPPGSVRASIISGDFSEIVFSLFVICIGIKVISLFIKRKFKLMYAAILGTIIVFLLKNVSPIITVDSICKVIISFVLIEFILWIITRIFKISTDHFGEFKQECYAAPLGKGSINFLEKEK